MKRKLSPNSIYDVSRLDEIFTESNVNLKHTGTIHRHLVQKYCPLNSIPTISKLAQQIILNDFVESTSKVISRTDAADQSTTKLLIELQDGKRIECCIMRYGEVTLSQYPKKNQTQKFKSNKRATLCISSQVGCAMACTFCATGTMGLTANLTSGEIIEQLVHASKITKIRNIVFMGMGEPLDNYKEVIDSIKFFTSTSTFGLSPTRITISTVGVVPKIRSLINDYPSIGLALSLHASNQKLREQIVPTSKAWHIDKIIAAVHAFITNQNAKSTLKTGDRKRHVLIEYVLIKDINDSLEVARELGLLLQNKSFLLNVIPYNHTDVPFDYDTPSIETCTAFVKSVRTYGIKVLFRQTMGDDISSACGQLVINSNKNTGCSTSAGNIDIEDIGKAAVLGTTKKLLTGKMQVGANVDPHKRAEKLKSINQVDNSEISKDVDRVATLDSKKISIDNQNCVHDYLRYALVGLSFVAIIRLASKIIK